MTPRKLDGEAGANSTTAAGWKVSTTLATTSAPIEWATNITGRSNGRTF